MYARRHVSDSCSTGTEVKTHAVPAASLFPMQAALSALCSAQVELPSSAVQVFITKLVSADLFEKQ